MRRLAVLFATVTLLANVAPALAASNDSLAPANAPPHWLPPEPWVYNHWLPFDEERLYALLGTDRAGVWRQLRDDHHTLAELAVARGTTAPALADALVAPARSHVSTQRLALLRSRAERVLTQGHLAQHVLFHSLHQFAIPSAAAAIFGVPDVQFRALRRSELSPFDIGALHGHAPGAVLAACTAVLRDRAAAGVAGQAMTAHQARLLLHRQLAQLPRWLGQARYNGPPQTHHGALVRIPRNYASNPVLAADGSRVAFEIYRELLPVTLRLGEIGVSSVDLATGTTTLVSPVTIPGQPAGPRASYNPTIAADGATVAFESAAGNLNFSKRYGAIGVFLARTGTTRIDAIPGAHGRVVTTSRSAYGPALAADGRHLVYQLVDRRGRTRVAVRDLASGQVILIDESTGTPLEPDVAADGTRLVYTLATAGRSQVIFRDLNAGTRLVDPVPGAAAQPRLSPDGRFVAFVAISPGASPKVMLWDTAKGNLATMSVPADGAALRPVVSRDGRAVAWTGVTGTGRAVLVRDTHRSQTTIVSRADGVDGALADGPAGDPSISADGRLVAFSSTATNLDGDKSDDTRGIFVRDRGASTTRLVSAPSHVAGTVVPPPVALTPPASPTTVLVSDNAFLAAQGGAVHARVGDLLRWRWQTTSSHNVTVIRGPERFAATTRNHGTFTHRVTRPGTYTIVCTLHEPGMTYTLEVAD
jgi:Tol biopolymer transport system component/plastocyanin